MNEQTLELLERLGVKGFTALLIYQFLDFLYLVLFLLLIGYGIKKGWPHFKQLYED